MEKKDTDVESVSHPDFLRDPEVLMRLWAHVSKEAGDGKDELHNVISLLSGGDNTVLQSSLGAAGLLELANENLAWSLWPPHLTMHTHTHRCRVARTHIQYICQIVLFRLATATVEICRVWYWNVNMSLKHRHRKNHLDTHTHTHTHTHTLWVRAWCKIKAPAQESDNRTWV